MTTFALKSPALRPSNWLAQLSTAFSGVVASASAAAEGISEARALERAAYQRYPFLID